jgi:phage tail-like protein
VSAPAPEPPRAASARRYLRGSLPAVYRDSPDGRALPVMGLLEGLEQVLDPVVVVLDNLAWHLRPASAPADMVDFLTELTGAPVDDTLPLAARRRLAMAAPHISASRGTRAGLQLALKCALPELEPQVRDNGQARWGRDTASMVAIRARDDGRAPPGEGTESATARAAFEVMVVREPSTLERAQIACCVADHLPVGATYALGVQGRGTEAH